MSSSVKNERENIYSLKGFGKVFSFTLKQTFKNRGFMVSFIIFVVVMIAMGPINYLSQNGGARTAEKAMNYDFENAETEKLYVLNESEIQISEDEIKTLFKDDEDNEFFETELVSGKTKDDLLNAIGDEDGIIYITQAEDGYKISGIVSDTSKIGPSEIDAIASKICGRYDELRMESINLSEDSIKMISSGVDMDGVISAGDYEAEQSKTVTSQKYMTCILGFSVLVMIVASMSSSYIITSVSEEKQSKLVETLLISVRPMALLLGKIAGMMTYVLMVLIVGIIGSRLSEFVMRNVLELDMSNYTGSGMDFSVFTDFGITGLLAVIVALMLAYLIFGILSGLLGSTCSKMEDMQNATGTMMTINMVGYFVAFVVGMLDKTIPCIVISLVPPFSLFSAPVLFVTGRIEWWMLLISFAIQLIIIILLTRISARTYRELILSDSSKPKLATVLGIKGR